MREDREVEVPDMRHSIARSAERRALRRLQSRERRLLVRARVDVAAGVLVALLLILLVPGLAIVALIAALALVACGLSLALERRRRHARARCADSRESRDRTTGGAPDSSPRRAPRR